MKQFRFSALRYTGFALLAAIVALTSSCDDEKSYAQLLTEEDHYVNNFLADQKVVNEIPADTVFEYGEDAPYYRIDKDGQLYMQVINPGTKGNMAEDDELIYFRYTRYELSLYDDGELPEGGGNNLALSPAWFRYKNYTLLQSYQWGEGIQTPLSLLPVDCEVNLVVKSTKGVISESSIVIPFLYHLTYSRPKI